LHLGTKTNVIDSSPVQHSLPKHPRGPGNKHAEMGAADQS